MDVNKIIAHTLQLEGGYTNNPDDRGNWTSGKKGEGELKGTKYGISSMTYPSLDIENLTEDQAVEIYRRDFWDKLHMDLLSSEDVAQKVFDAQVNTGRGIRWLQETVGAKVDGILGNQTANLTNAGNTEQIVNEIRKKQCLHYATIVARDPSQSQFIVGWIKRAFA